MTPWCVRVVTQGVGLLDQAFESRGFLEALAAAGLVKVHRNEGGYQPATGSGGVCFDIQPATGSARTFADGLVAAGLNAVPAPGWPGDEAVPIRERIETVDQAVAALTTALGLVQSVARWADRAGWGTGPARGSLDVVVAALQRLAGGLAVARDEGKTPAPLRTGLGSCDVAGCTNDRVMYRNDCGRHGVKP